MKRRNFHSPANFSYFCTTCKNAYRRSSEYKPCKFGRSPGTHKKAYHRPSKYIPSVPIYCTAFIAIRIYISYYKRLTENDHDCGVRFVGFVRGRVALDPEVSPEVALTNLWQFFARKRLKNLSQSTSFDNVAVLK